MTTCPDCKGTGKIELLTSIRDCDACKSVCRNLELGQVSYNLTDQIMSVYDGQKWVTVTSEVDKIKSKMEPDVREAYELMEEMTKHRRNFDQWRPLVWFGDAQQQFAPVHSTGNS